MLQTKSSNLLGVFLDLGFRVITKSSCIYFNLYPTFRILHTGHIQGLLNFLEVGYYLIALVYKCMSLINQLHIPPLLPLLALTYNSKASKLLIYS